MNKEAIDSFLRDFARVGSYVGRGGRLSLEAVHAALSRAEAESQEDYRVRCVRIFRVHSYIYLHYEALRISGFIIGEGAEEKIHQPILVATFLVFPRHLIDDPELPEIENVIEVAANLTRDGRK